MWCMTVRKISVALDESVARRVASTAKDSGMSVSAWLNAAAEQALRVEAGLAAVRGWEAEFGVFTADELAWADAVLDGVNADGE